MSFPSRPKLLRGAFVEYGFSLPPLLFAFQFNPETLTRGRTATYQARGAGASGGDGPVVAIPPRPWTDRAWRRLPSPKKRSGWLQLDATDQLNDGDGVTEDFGIGPQLSVLELMIYPKTDQLLGLPIGVLLGTTDQFGAAQAKVIPILLFVWGRKRVMPVVMTSLQITEQEYFPDLNPNGPALQCN